MPQGFGTACGHPHSVVEKDGDPTAPAACPLQVTQERNPGVPEFLNPIPLKPLSPKGQCHPTPRPSLAHCQCPTSPVCSARAARVSQFIARCQGGWGYTRQTLREAVSEWRAMGAAGRGQGRAVPLTPPACSLPAIPLGRHTPPRRGPLLRPVAALALWPPAPPTSLSSPPCSEASGQGGAGARGSVGGRRCWHYCYGGREQRDPPHAQITVSKSVAFSLGGSGASSLASASGVRYSRWCWPQIGVVRSCQRCGDTVSAPRDNNTGTAWTRLGEFPAMHRDRKGVGFGWGWK